MIPNQGWRRQAACRGVKGFTEAPQPLQIAVCKTCPVTDECLDFELQFDDYVGTETKIVFGGLTDEQLAELKRQRRQARQGRAA